LDAFIHNLFGGAMYRKFVVVLMLSLFAAMVMAPLMSGGEAFAEGPLERAIAKAPKGTEPGQIDPDAPPVTWASPVPSRSTCWWLLSGPIWVGWVFSTVGAFGGIMAGVGHISVFGLGAYAKTFKDSAPELNKVVTDSIRVSNQWLVGLSAAVSSLNYGKQKRLIVPLGIVLGMGSLLAAFPGGLHHHGQDQVLSVPGLFRPDRLHHWRIHGL
jgi:uncharacterized protein